MTISLTELRTYLENNSVTVKYIKNDILYCHGDTRYTSFKITQPNEDTAFKVMKESLSGNVWSETFNSKHNLAEFLHEKQDS